MQYLLSRRMYKRILYMVSNQSYLIQDNDILQ